MTNTTYEYTAQSTSKVIKLPEPFVKGSVTADGYTIKELDFGDDRSVLIKPNPEIGSVIKITYTPIKKEKKRVNVEPVNSVHNKILNDLVKTVANQQVAIEQLMDALKNRATYQDIAAMNDTIMSEVALIKEYLSVSGE